MLFLEAPFLLRWQLATAPTPPGPNAVPLPAPAYRLPTMILLLLGPTRTYASPTPTRSLTAVAMCCPLPPPKVMFAPLYYLYSGISAALGPLAPGAAEVLDGAVEAAGSRLVALVRRGWREGGDSGGLVAAGVVPPGHLAKLAALGTQFGAVVGVAVGMAAAAVVPAAAMMAALVSASSASHAARKQRA